MKKLVFSVIVVTFLVSATNSLAYFERRGVLGESTSSAKVREEAKQKNREKLSEAKKKICLARHSVIRARSLGVVARARGLNARVETYVAAAKGFYTEKLLPAGKVVENYDQLVAAVDSAKTQVQADLTSAQEAAKAFDCKGEDPKGKLTTFKTETREFMDSLKSYKAAVKELLQAIRTAAKEEG